MTKKQATMMFMQDIFPKVKKNGKDMPALRQSWNDFVDFLCKNGDITSRQAETWDHPAILHSEKIWYST